MMEFRRLGSTVLEVSAFGMGCGNFGGIGSSPEFFGQGESESEAFALLDKALDLGLNFFDTADAYGGGRSEMALGRWLKSKGPAVRDRVLISSKVGNPVGPQHERAGLSHRHVLRQIDESLGRLGVDHLDMYLAHEPDPSTPIAETVGAFDEVVARGKVRHIGISNHSVGVVESALDFAAAEGLHSFGWVQDSFNLIEQHEQAERVALCSDRGLGYTPFSPLFGGWLTGKYRSSETYPTGSRMTLRPEPYESYLTASTLAAIDRLCEAAADYRVSPGGLALAWLCRHPAITAPIIGPRRLAHFAPVEEALTLDLNEKGWAEIGAFFPASYGGNQQR